MLSFLTLAMLLVSWHLAAQGEQVNATDKSFTELAPLSRPDSPNNWLVAPSDFASAKADQAAPVFDQPSDRLARSWIAVIEKQPRTTILRVSEDGLQVEAQQRSAVFGFIDRISAWFIPVAPEVHSDRLQPIARRILGPGRQPQPITTMVDRPEEGRGSRRVNAMRLVPQRLRGTGRTGVAGAVKGAPRRRDGVITHPERASSRSMCVPNRIN
jgi:hypothetical protein